tara:strand:- start:622 stop:858 length:237 start_codon:yes stop_codon:yes gene_type:complete
MGDTEMRLTPQGSNMTELYINGTTILFSYSTPVAGYDRQGAFRTGEWYSSTTTRHINKYLGKGNGREVTQDYIDSLVS